MKISEVSKLTGISEYTLRYYEQKELIRVNRDSFNRRDYEENEIEWILFIKKLKDTGMILQEIAKYSSLRYDGDSTLIERREMLLNHKDNIKLEILKWKKYLENINEKIEIYNKKINDSI